MVGGVMGRSPKDCTRDKNTGFLIFSALPVVLFGFTFCILVRGYNL